MPVIIEDGSIVPGANSYATVTEARDYAALRGVTLAPSGPEGDVAVSVMLVKAGDYLNTLHYKGEMVEPLVQGMQWPRTGVVLYGDEWPIDEIPSKLIAAQCQLCIEIFRNVDLMPTTGGATAAVIREKVGPLETQYSEALLINGGSPINIPAVNSLLSSLLDAPGGFGLITRRV